jgi:hypothetical protein
MLCPNGTVKPFLVSLVEPVAYLKSELAMIGRRTRTWVGFNKRVYKLPTHQGVVLESQTALL